MTIKALRISFVFTETILDLQRNDDPARPLNSIVREPGYVGAINRLKKGSALPLDLDLPWNRPVGQHFWDRYLDEKGAGNSDGKLCFQKLVPLRFPKLTASLGAGMSNIAPPAKAKFRMEGYYYPYGTGLVVTVDLTGSLDVATAGQLALSCRYDPLYRTGRTPAAITLNQLATEALDRLRELGFGAGISGWRSDLFSVATVLEGSDIEIGQPIVFDSLPHRLLNGLANWGRDWSQRPAPAFVPAKTQLHVRKNSIYPSHMLFGGSRGRAVWLPGLFLPTAPTTSVIRCYHRNLAFASLQTESLLGLAREVNSEIQSAGAVGVPNSFDRFGRLAAGLLTRLYSRTGTYQSDSTRAQIVQSAQFGAINPLRARFDMAPPL